MRKLLVWHAMVLFGLTVACAPQPEPEQAEPTPKAERTAHAKLINAEGKEIGEATLREVEGGVEIRLVASALPPGEHGFHIHENGVCEPPDFKTAGGHFNPTGKQHGRENPMGHHVGDLPNITVKDDGTVEVTTIIEEATLSEGPNSLLKPGGTAVMIHEKPDDNKTDPAGNAGARIACGVIQAK